MSILPQIPVDIDAAKETGLLRSRGMMRFFNGLMVSALLCSCLLLVFFFFTSVAWPLRFSENQAQSYDLSHLGFGARVLDSHCPSIIAYDKPGALTLHFAPTQPKNTPFSIRVRSEAPDQVQLAYPENGVQSPEVEVPFDGSVSSQAVISLYNQQKGWGALPFFYPARITMDIIDAQRVVVPGPVTACALGLESASISLLRHYAANRLDSSLILAFSITVSIVSIYLRMRKSRQEDERNRQAEAEKLLNGVRMQLKEGKLADAKEDLEKLKKPDYANMVHAVDLDWADKLISSDGKSGLDKFFFVSFPEGWADETAGVLEIKIKALSIIDQILLLRRFPADRCSLNHRQKIFELRQQTRMPVPAENPNWPLMFPYEAPREKIKIEGSQFYNPFIALRAEEEEKYLFMQGNHSLFYRDHSIFQNLKEFHAQPLECVFGEQGVGRTTLGLALSKYHSARSVLGVFIPGLPDANRIRVGLCQRLFDFVCANPAYLCVLDVYSLQMLANLLVGQLHSYSIHARLNRVANTRKITRPGDSLDLTKEQITEEDKVQINLFAQALDHANQEPISAQHWLLAFQQVAYDLGFHRTSLVVDAPKSISPEWLEKNIDHYCQDLAVAGVQTTLLVPLPEDPRRFKPALIKAFEALDVPCHPFCWEGSLTDSLDKMLGFRWETYNITHIREHTPIPYDGWLAQSENNPRNFIRLWQQKYPPGRS